MDGWTDGWMDGWMIEGDTTALGCHAAPARTPEHLPPLLHAPLTAGGCPRPPLRARGRSAARICLFPEGTGNPGGRLMPSKVSRCLPLR